MSCVLVLAFQDARAGEARPADCAALRASLERALDLRAGLRLDADVPMPPDIPGTPGRACRLSLEATGLVMETPRTPDFARLAEEIRRTLAAAGWREGENTLRFDADGPDGTAFGLAKAGEICVSRVNVDGLAAGHCPPDGPADLYGEPCGLKPWQRRYRLEVACFRPGD